MDVIDRLNQLQSEYPVHVGRLVKLLCEHRDEVKLEQGEARAVLFDWGAHEAGMVSSILTEGIGLN